jgi:hypothetical protein
MSRRGPIGPGFPPSCSPSRPAGPKASPGGPILSPSLRDQAAAKAHGATGSPLRQPPRAGLSKSASTVGLGPLRTGGCRRTCQPSSPPTGAIHAPPGAAPRFFARLGSFRRLKTNRRRRSSARSALGIARPPSARPLGSCAPASASTVEVIDPASLTRRFFAED